MAPTEAEQVVTRLWAERYTELVDAEPDPLRKERLKFWLSLAGELAFPYRDRDSWHAGFYIAQDLDLAVAIVEVLLHVIEKHLDCCVNRELIARLDTMVEAVIEPIRDKTEALFPTIYRYAKEYPFPRDGTDRSDQP